MVQLFQEFSKAAGSEVGISDTMIDDINKLLGVLKLLAASGVHLLVFLLQRLYFEVIELVLPGVGPALTLSVPDPGARLRLTVFHT
jgi:hypothetical protein